MIRNISYTASRNPLHTLDLWLPDSITGEEPVLFVVYLHGGAWVDPAQDASEGHVLLDHLQRQNIPNVKIACASINYRLSLPGTNVKHPDHMYDVAQALDFLKRNYDLRRCILVGHSAGATLAVQVFHEFRREVMALILFNGIYDLEALVDEYPEYNSFVAAAFGDLDKKYELIDTHSMTKLTSSSDWALASPTTIIQTTNIRPEHLHELVVLAHSPDDELLSMRQTDMFHEIMQKKWGEPIGREQIHGKHDDSPHSEEMQRISLDVLNKIAHKVLV